MNPVKNLRMAKSQESMSEKMNIFNVPSTDVSCEGKCTLVVSNKNPLTDNVIYFEYDVGGGIMTVPEGIELEVTGKIVKANGDNVPAMPTDSWTAAGITAAKKTALQAADVSPINQLLFSLFKYARVRVQDQYVECNDFDMRAMLESIVNVKHGNDERNISQLCVSEYSSNKGKHSAIPTHPKYNSTSGVLANIVSGSKEFQMRGKLPLDFCNIKKFMLSRVPIGIELFFNEPSTYLFSSKDNADFKFSMTDCKLYVPYVRVNPSLELANADLLKQNKPAVYPFVSSVLRKYTVSSGNHLFQTEDLFQGKVPMETLVCMVSSEDASSGYTHNPYSFQSFKLSEIKFKVDEITSSMKMKFSSDGNKTAQPFMALTNMYPELEMSMSTFKKVTPFFVFDTRNNYEDGSLPMLRKGFTRLEMRFDEPLTKNIIVYVLAKFPSVMQIDEARSVTV
jgi:hypothetical protein